MVGEKTSFPEPEGPEDKFIPVGDDAFLNRLVRYIHMDGFSLLTGHLAGYRAG